MREPGGPTDRAEVANPAALEASANPELGRTFNTKAAANPCAANGVAGDPCATKS